MIKVVTNSMGSGDWITVQDTNTGETLFEGHRISARNLVDILSFDGSTEAKLIEVSDEEMEEGVF